MAAVAQLRVQLSELAPRLCDLVIGDGRAHEASCYQRSDLGALPLGLPASEQCSSSNGEIRYAVRDVHHHESVPCSYISVPHPRPTPHVGGTRLRGSHAHDHTHLLVRRHLVLYHLYTRVASSHPKRLLRRPLRRRLPCSSHRIATRLRLVDLHARLAEVIKGLALWGESEGVGEGEGVRVRASKGV